MITKTEVSKRATLRSIYALGFLITCDDYS